MNRPEELKSLILSQKPTDQQREAIFADDSEFLLRASPGSGKTWTSCRRFLWRAENRNGPGGIALLSFTNTAIREFEAASVEIGRRQFLSDPNFVGTFDSFVERFIINTFGHIIPGTTKRPRLFPGERPGDWNNSRLIAWVSNNGRKLRIPAWLISPRIEAGNIVFDGSFGYGSLRVPTAEAYKTISQLLQYGYYTHSHRAFWAVRILEDHPDIAQLLARRFPEILVDEAQDTNIWLLQVLRYIRQAGSRVTLVGDPDQCIFAFSQASASSLEELRSEWGLKKKPLNQSFRCNDIIAKTVRNISDNTAFIGYGPPQNEQCRAYVIADSSDEYDDSLSFFRAKLKEADIQERNAAILCRGHEQLGKIRGELRFSSFKGKTKRLANIAFLRDVDGEYAKAYEKLVVLLRELCDAPEVWDVLDELPDSTQAQAIKLQLWRFIRSEHGLPSIDLSATDWLTCVRERLAALLSSVGVKSPVKLGHTIKKTGMDTKQMTLPLFEQQAADPAMRHETIHQVKGESIDAIMLIGSKPFYDKVVKAALSNSESEERRLAYVAMTRARHLVVVAVPQNHYAKQKAVWQEWGFDCHT
ncbi:MAG: ATP-dependent helicase [Verrucomicrobia bacterium]|jgi:superfamily I DNA/RNA helicase|nr:ATP-dependent helicase [Verrucomicrobiota bacterium]